MDRLGRLSRCARALFALTLVIVLVAAGGAAAAPAPITEFSSGVTDPASLTAGPDGNVWFTDQGAIGRITPAGHVTEFKSGLNPGAMPLALALGSDGSLWFTDGGTTKSIGRITPAGQITEFTAGLDPGAGPTELTAGPNGTLWFLDPGAKAVGRVTAATGAISEFDYTADANPTFDRIAPGPDGNIYFTDKGNVPGIGRVTPAGNVTEVSTGATSMPSELGGGPDGALWFSDQQTPNALGQLTAAGGLTEFPSGLQSGAAVDAVIAGPDGKVWFDDQYSTHPAVGSITPAGQITEFPTPGDPGAIVFGVDGNLWATEFNPQQIQRITLSGSKTTFSAGLNAGTDFNDSELIVGPDGNLWFADRGTPKAIGEIGVQAPPAAQTGAAVLTAAGATLQGTVNPLGASTTAHFDYGTTQALGSSADAGALTASGDPSPVSAAVTGLPAGATIYYRVSAANAYGTTPGTIRNFSTPAVTPITPPGPIPPKRATTTAKVGDQLVSLGTPAPTLCTARTGRLSVTLSAARIAHSTRARLRFVSAALTIDRGVRHRHIRRVKGRRRTVTTYVPNVTLRRLPAVRGVRLSGLRTGVHHLTVAMIFTRVGRHGSAVHARLRVGFRVC